MNTPEMRDDRETYLKLRDSVYFDNSSGITVYTHLDNDVLIVIDDWIERIVFKLDVE